MKCVLVAVTSQDGFITRGEESDVRTWISKEEQEWFANVLLNYPLQVFGSGTFDALRPQPREGVCKVVLTSTTNNYRELEVPGRLEFRTLSPESFLQEYSEKYAKCLVLGGTSVYEEFLISELIDEAFVVIEPIIHGNGKRLVNDSVAFTKAGLAEKSRTQLNDSGTILVHYQR